MSVVQRMFSTRGSKIHLVAFLLLSLVFIAVDLSQGRSGEINLATLDWAYLLIIIWAPIVTIHAVLNLWTHAERHLGIETARDLRQNVDHWFHGGPE
ncbi:MAG: hypothetical protein QNL12_00500 [Acidimicrobiia bacterium]|nr:hypothetical protein [Acidimicrobiia bacterium]MDX2465765.1 hypothetical protein [Acidimicrobiia bacterium]